MKRLNKKGFTLIELLAVIIILGILMIIAIPSVTSYIQNSRKSAYVDTAVAYADAVMKEVNGGKNLRLYSTSTLYMIPVGHVEGTSCVTVESGGQSPFSDQWYYAFIGVTYNGKGYNYYFIGQDGAGQGVSFIDKKELTDNGTDYIYSTYKSGSADEAGATKKSTDNITEGFAQYLAGKYSVTANESSSITTSESTVMVKYITGDETLGLTAKEPGKTISTIMYISPPACTQTEQVTANPAPTTTG